jgi:hypothetical protein
VVESPVHLGAAARHVFAQGLDVVRILHGLAPQQGGALCIFATIVMSVLGGMRSGFQERRFPALEGCINSPRSGNLRVGLASYGEFTWLTCQTHVM